MTAIDCQKSQSQAVKYRLACRRKDGTFCGRVDTDTDRILYDVARLLKEGQIKELTIVQVQTMQGAMLQFADKLFRESGETPDLRR